MQNLSIQKLAEIVDGRLKLGSLPAASGEELTAKRIVTDNRQVTQGTVFWALTGPGYDGAQFAEEAFSRGADGVVVAGRSVEPWAGKFSIQVDHAYNALTRLAHWRRERFQGTVIAVAGGLGLATARKMIGTVLGETTAHEVDSRYPTQDAAPLLSVINWQPERPFGLVEFRPGRRPLGELASVCRPKIGVFTCVGSATVHGEGGDHLRQYGDLAASLPSDGWAVLSGDERRFRQLETRTSAKVLRFGTTTDCSILAREVCYREGNLSYLLEDNEFQIPVWGRHHLASALAACGVGHVTGLAQSMVCQTLKRFQTPPSRCEVIRSPDGFTIIDDTNNTGESALGAALALLREFDHCRRRIFVYGQLDDAQQTSPQIDASQHRRVGEQAVHFGHADMLIAIGSQAREALMGARDAGLSLDRVIACNGLQQAKSFLRGRLISGDVVLVKGNYGKHSLVSDLLQTAKPTFA